MSRQPLQTTSQLQLPNTSALDSNDPVRQLTLAVSQQNTRIFNDLTMIFNAMPQNSGVLYFGDPSVNGTWKIINSGNNLSVQRLEVGVWNEKFAFTP